MSRLTRAAALVAVPVLALGVLPAPTAGAAQAQADDAAGYLAAQLDGGLLTYESFGSPYTDFGGSIDAAIAFDGVGGHSADIAAIATAISSRLSDYTDYAYTDDDYSTTPPTTGPLIEGRSAGGTAKSIVALQLAGQDPTAHPDGNLVERLEGLVQTDGRIADQVTRGSAPYPAGDFANNFGQTFAVTALNQAGSSRAADATAFLRSQQCDDDGYFTEAFVAPSAACADPTKSSVDATALAVNAFAPLPAAATGNNYVFYRALGYLQNAQRGNGGFGTTTGAAPNANSTGLAVAALRQIASIDLSFEYYATPLAEQGAAWLRAHQLENVATCTPYAATELGAVAYDDAARDAAVDAGITAPLEGQFLKATTQSAVGLLSAPSTPTVLKAKAPTAYVADGSTQTIQVSGATPGSPVCLSTGTVQRSTSVLGTVGFSVKAPAKTATTTFTFTGVDGAPATAAIKSLGPKTLSLRVRAKVARGGTQRSIVTGLAPGEMVSVRMSGKTVKSGVADAKGVYNVIFKVSKTPGTKTVSVVGQFADRKATKKFTVVK